jgi:hypothetical protein
MLRLHVIAPRLDLCVIFMSRRYSSLSGNDPSTVLYQELQASFLLQQLERF